MLKFIVICIFLYSVSCGCRSTLSHQIDPGQPYSDWINTVSKLVVKEAPIVCSEWPAQWGECTADTTIYMDYFRSIDIDSNTMIIDSLLAANHLTQKDNYEIAVLEQFADGFNQWHCTTFVIFRTHGQKTIGIEICKSSPDWDVTLLKHETPTKEPIDLDKKYINAQIKLKSGTLSTSDFRVVTILDKRYNIKRCRVILYP